MVAFATQVKRRRGTAAQNNEFTGAAGEIVVNLTDKSLRVHDGQTKGGFETLRQNMQNSVNITNCITKISQDIKLELANGVLTLKAGSTYYTPNGVDTYTKTTTTADKTLTNTNNTQWAVFINQRGNLQVWDVNALYSGATAPSGVSYPMWWDITNNIIKISNDSGATWEQQFSLPLCIITVSNGAISSIDEIFNGYGYMGSTEFVLPGVDGLTSYGFNDDGTYKNLLMRTSQVKTLTVSGNTSIKIAIRTDGSPVWYTASAVKYDKVSNRVLYTGTPRNTIIAGEFDVVNGRIQNFTPYKTFHAVDYNEFKDFVHQTGEETITGPKTFSSSITSDTGVGNPAIKNTDGGQLWLMPSADTTYNGGFILRGINSDSSFVDLVGKGTGALMWNGKNVTYTEAQSLAQNGYVKFNNGLILQWGRLETTGQTRTINFPTEFTTTNYFVAATPMVTASVYSEFFTIVINDESKTTTNIEIRTGGNTEEKTCVWFAIGY